MPHNAPPLAIIGFGNMGSAIVRGVLATGLLTPDRMVIAEPDGAKCAGLARVHATALGALKALHELESTGDGQQGQILLAVKPQKLAIAAEGLEEVVGDRIVISILAGTPSSKVREMLGGRARVVRAMPNLPASVGQGATALAIGEGATVADRAFARRLFTGIGPLVLDVEEKMMDAFTALAGSGPAYLFYLAESMTHAAKAMGFSPEHATAAVRQTLVGAAAMLAHGAKSPAELRAAVTSKGGTTAAAMTVLDEHHVAQHIESAVMAARTRSEELGKL